MTEFKNTEISEFSGVWVFCEQRDGEIVEHHPVFGYLPEACLGEECLLAESRHLDGGVHQLLQLGGEVLSFSSFVRFHILRVVPGTGYDVRRCRDSPGFQKPDTYTGRKLAFHPHDVCRSVRRHGSRKRIENLYDSALFSSRFSSHFRHKSAEYDDSEWR